MNPTIFVGMIARNEARDIGRCLKSVAEVADGLILIDTGSTDDTIQAARDSWPQDKQFHARGYTGASKLVDGQWQLQNFSKARNEYMREAKERGATWILSLDADDEIVTPDAFRRACYWGTIDTFSVWIQDGSSKWLTHRLFKVEKDIRYEGRCHEYGQLKGLHGGVISDGLIRHHGEPSANQENSNARNIRMLTDEWEEEGPKPRTAFYIANTHRDGERFKEACEWYEKRIAMGEHYRDEWLFAHLYGARCYRFLGQHTDCERLIHQGLVAAPDWMEFQFERARSLYDQKRYDEAISISLSCIDRTIPHTELWREPGAYTDGPRRLISHCYAAMGLHGMALAWADEAKEHIVGPDADWDEHRKRLREAIIGAPAILTGKKPAIALVRPGAIGDILMTLNLIPALKAANPDHDIHYFCHESLAKEDAMGWIIKAAGAMPMVGEPGKSYDRTIRLIGYPLKENYPEVPMRKHLISYFAEEMGLDPNAEYTLTLPRPPLPEWAHKDYATVQMVAGWSKFKMWPDWEERWQRVIERCTMNFYGLHEKVTPTLREAIAVFANAKMHVGVDSWANHATNYWWHEEGEPRDYRVPSVILWGSTSPIGSGYEHNVNLYKGLHCQPCYRENPAISRMPRGPCINVLDGGWAIGDKIGKRYAKADSYDDPRPHECMNSITVDEVVEAVRTMWERVK